MKIDGEFSGEEILAIDEFLNTLKRGDFEDTLRHLLSNEFNSTAMEKLGKAIGDQAEKLHEEMRPKDPRQVMLTNKQGNRLLGTGKVDLPLAIRIIPVGEVCYVISLSGKRLTCVRTTTGLVRVMELE